MTTNIARMVFICFLTISFAITTAMGIMVSVTSSDSAETTSSSQSYDLDTSTWLKQDINLDSGKISSNLQAEGGGENRLTQSLSASNYALTSDVNSRGTFFCIYILFCFRTGGLY
jgi:hypothetical protein